MATDPTSSRAVREMFGKRTKIFMQAWPTAATLMYRHAISTYVRMRNDQPQFPLPLERESGEHTCLINC